MSFCGTSCCEILPYFVHGFVFKLMNINTCVFRVSNAVQKETGAAKLLLAVFKCCWTRLGLHFVKATRCWDVKTHEPIFTNKTEQLA